MFQLRSNRGRDFSDVHRPERICAGLCVISWLAIPRQPRAHLTQELRACIPALTREAFGRPASRLSVWMSTSAPTLRSRLPVTPPARWLSRPTEPGSSTWPGIHRRFSSGDWTTATPPNFPTRGVRACRSFLLTANGLTSAPSNHILVELGVVIEHDAPVRSRFRECFAQLLHNPDRSGVGRDIEVHDPAPAVLDDE